MNIIKIRIEVMVIIIKCLAYWRGQSFFFTTRDHQMVVSIDTTIDCVKWNQLESIRAPGAQLEHWNFWQSECLIRIDLFVNALLIKKFLSFGCNETNDSQFIFFLLLRTDNSIIKPNIGVFENQDVRMWLREITIRWMLIRKRLRRRIIYYQCRFKVCSESILEELTWKLHNELIVNDESICST